jgi:hypothetical protein
MSPEKGSGQSRFFPSFHVQISRALYLLGSRGTQSKGNNVRIKDIVYTRLAMATSGVHSIMMEKSAQAVEGGGARPPPLVRVGA